MAFLIKMQSPDVVKLVLNLSCTLGSPGELVKNFNPRILPSTKWMRTSGAQVSFLVLFVVWLVGWLMDFLMLSGWFGYTVRLKTNYHKIKPWDYLSHHCGNYQTFFVKSGPTATLLCSCHTAPSSVRGLLPSLLSPRNKRTDPLHSCNVKNLSVHHKGCWQETEVILKLGNFRRL